MLRLPLSHSLTLDALPAVNVLPSNVKMQARRPHEATAYTAPKRC